VDDHEPIFHSFVGRIQVNRIVFEADYKSTSLDKRHFYINAALLVLEYRQVSSIVVYMYYLEM
jgi:hypothetical protein